MTGKKYNGYTQWNHKGASITLADGSSKFQIMHFVEGMDGNFHRVFWQTDTLEDAIAYIDKLD